MSLYRIKNNTDLSMKGTNTVASATSLLSEAVYYVDATAPTNWGSLGFVRLPGVANNNLSVSDSSALDITGDLDLRWYGALDSWATGFQALISKWSTSGNFSYTLYVEPAGTLVLGWTTNGSTVIGRTSTAATGFSAGALKWVRATLDVDNGASGHDVRFFTSDDGTNWTQLGTTITTAGTTSIFSGSNDVIFGQQAGSNLATGRFYRAQILNGIGGTTVLDVNIASNFTSSSFNTFTATTGQTVTVNGVGIVTNLGTAGSLLPTTVGSSTAADSNDPKFLDHTGTNYVYLSGVAANYLSVPDSNALDITGDIDLRWYGSFDSLTPTGNGALIDKTSSATTRSYRLNLASDGKVGLNWSVDGSAALSAVSTALLSTVATVGRPIWVRATLDVDNGASGNDVKFYTSTDGTTWTQLGTTVTAAGVTSIFASTSNVEIGSTFVGTLQVHSHKVFRAQILDGIDGTTVLDVDTSVITAGSATSFTAVTGQTVTINRSTSGRKSVAVTQPTWLFGTDDYMEVNNRYMSSGTYLYLPGVAGNYASTPDSAALDITGDIDLRVKVALDDWTPAAANVFIAKDTGSTQRSYQLYIDTVGRLNLAWFPLGTSASGIFTTSSVATGVTDGATKWVRATLDVDNGAGQYEVKFWLSNDGITWTELGTTVTGATGTTTIFNSTSQLEIGTSNGGTNAPARAKFFRAQVLDGIDGTVAFDANFETSITSLLQTTFTESSTNAATVTINRSGSTYRSAGITEAGYLYPGATNTFSASATDFFNFPAGTDFSILAIIRQWNTAVGAGPYFSSTTQTNNTGKGWQIDNDDVRVGGLTSNILQVLSFTPATAGNLSSIVATKNSTPTLTAYVNNASTSAAFTPTGDIGKDILTIATRIGRTSFTTVYQDFEGVAFAVWRRRLLAPEIGAITNYFNARGV
jgi:hypothetical protein